MKNDKIHLFIANNREVERLGIHTIINTTQNISIIGETNNCHEIKRFIVQFCPDILLFDPDLFGMHFEIRECWLREICHKTKVIIYSNDDRANHIAMSMDCGALGYINKKESAEYLIQSINLASEGRVLFTQDQFEKAIQWKTEIEAVNSSLSNREHLVISYLSRGMSNREIAGEMNVSVKTVETYITNILQTLELKSRSEIICWIFAHFPEIVSSGD